MTVRLLLFLLITLSAKKVSAQKHSYPSCPTDSEIYSFLKEVNPMTAMPQYDLQDTVADNCDLFYPDGPHMPAGRLTYLKAELMKYGIIKDDLKEFKRQYKYCVSIQKWDSTRLEGIHVRDDKWEGPYRFRFLSVPLFSKDHNRAILQGTFICGGECGEKELYIFQKEENHWRLKKKIQIGVF